jgi:hypothetical protein
MKEPRNLDILTVNPHTGYLYNLSKIGHHWRFLNPWVEHNRPSPPNFESIDWATARQDFPKFDAVIGHIDEPIEFCRNLTRFCRQAARFFSEPPTGKAR